MAFKEVARLEDVQQGLVTVVEVDGQEIALCRIRDQVYALSNTCSHDGGALNQGETMGYMIECPRHGARFDIRTGQVLALPAVEPLPTFPVRVEDGVIAVDPEG